MNSISQQTVVPAGTDNPGGRAQLGTIEYLLESMRRGSDFPALSESIRSVNQLADSREQDVRSLASVIIGDFALTNKMLKVVNSAFYSSFSGKIGSISRAIIVLGIEEVRSLAASLIFLEHLNDKSQASRLRDQISAAIFSATLARQVAGNIGLKNTEGSFLCGMLQSLGGILVTYYLQEEGAEIDRLIETMDLDPKAAQKRVLGMTFDQIGVSMAKHWNFPSVITGGMCRADSVAGNGLRSEELQLRLIASFANDAAVAIGKGEINGAIARDGSLNKYLKLFSLDERRFRELVDEARKEFSELNGAFRNDDPEAPTPFVSRLNGEREKLRAEGRAQGDNEDESSASRGLDNGVCAVPETGASIDSTTVDAEQIMTEGLQEVSGLLTGERCSINQVFNVVLETLYRAMEFQHVLLCLKDKQQRILGRLGFGQDIETFLKGFSFSVKYTPDVFHVAIKNGVDLYIEDTHATKIRSDLPEWYLSAADAGSFILLPVVLNKTPLGLIYADHTRPRALEFSGNRLNLMKALRNQILLAFRTCC